MSFDTALLGVIIGSILSIAGNFVTQWVTMRKEVSHWERQQRAEEKRREAEEESQARKVTVGIYQNCISCLSLIAALNAGNLDTSAEEKLQLYKDTLHWLALLSLHRSDLSAEESQNLQHWIKAFAESPNSFTDILLDEVKRLVMSDQTLSPGRRPMPKRSPGKKRVQVDVADDFRRKSAIAGKEVPNSHMFDCDIAVLTPSQREKLWDMHNKAIPDTIYLSLPTYDETKNQIVLKGSGIWKADLDPTSSSPQAIFHSWEQAYDKALESAMQVIELR